MKWEDETIIIALDELNQELLNCKACPLWETRTQVITGEGISEAKVLLLGEAPGGHEDMISGRVFTGEAGKQLQDFLNLIEIKRNQIYLTNTVKCRPTKPSTRGRYGPYANRKPKAMEIKACSQWLDQELRLVSPKVIVTLGAVPLAKLLAKNIPMKAIHGQPFFNKHYQAWVFPLFHPAAIIYNSKLEPLYLKDLQKLKTFIQEHC